jgi:hypothetical protein
VVVSDLTNIATIKNMGNKKFLLEIEARLTEEEVSEATINYMIGKIKQSFRNGVEVGKKQADEQPVE